MMKLERSLPCLFLPLALACGGPDMETVQTESPLSGAFVCPRACDVVPGDANVDGQANIADVDLINRYLFVGGVATPCLSAADVNQDGHVDVSDAILISQYTNGQAVTLQGPHCNICSALCTRIVAGDVNADGRTDITDLGNLGGWLSQGNPRHVCERAADVNGDGVVDISDLQVLAGYFSGSASLSAPRCDRLSRRFAPVRGPLRSGR